MKIHSPNTQQHKYELKYRNVKYAQINYYVRKIFLFSKKLQNDLVFHLAI